MNKGSSSYYYMSSSSVTTYNENGCKRSKQQVRINKNGNVDHYYKDSIVENGQEKIIKEDGNKKYEAKEFFLPRQKQLLNWNTFFEPLWFKFPYIGNFLLDNHQEEDSDVESVEDSDVKSEEDSINEINENNNDDNKNENADEINENTGEINENEIKEDTTIQQNDKNINIIQQ
ncbi:putative orfan [Tupanvirus soda lake]|uniref:Orfan n=2 Tax=Tupanvirus TaxID=2094720 RepID=A0AC62ADU7_9VIRU|nr:putative orfan [Tupanvirus soda lake]QKU35911.1 putative orfan [Tupanvirus soda lake]